jgi:hypothetical protein
MSLLRQTVNIRSSEFKCFLFISILHMFRCVVQDNPAIIFSHNEDFLLQGQGHVSIRTITFFICSVHKHQFRKTVKKINLNAYGG